MQSTRYPFQILIRLQFSRHIFEKKTQYEIVLKSFQWKPEFFHADGRTDIKTVIAFRNFVKAPEKETHRSQASKISIRWTI